MPECSYLQIWDKTYSTEFRNIFSDLAEKNALALIPFLLEDVGGIPELNQEDGIHPTVEGQKIVANNVWAGFAKGVGRIKIIKTYSLNRLTYRWF